jgi:hypothetical protein
MKKSLQLSLAVLAVSVLTACGSGGSEDAADKYVGTWKSVCFSYVATNGTTYYTNRFLTYTKSNATELISDIVFKTVYLDAACKNPYGPYAANSHPGKLNIGTQAKFLEQSVDTIVETDTATGATYTGYATANSTQVLIVTFTAGQTPAGWGKYSPYTKE